MGSLPLNHPRGPYPRSRTILIQILFPPFSLILQIYALWLTPKSLFLSLSVTISMEWVAIPFSRGVFLTQGLNPGLPHSRHLLYHLSHWSFIKWTRTTISCECFQPCFCFFIHDIQFWPCALSFSHSPTLQRQSLSFDSIVLGLLWCWDWDSEREEERERRGGQTESIKLENKRKWGKEDLNKYGSGSWLGSSLVTQWLRTCLPMRETWVWSLGRKDPQKEMAIHSNILAWEIPWTEEPGGLQSMELQMSRKWLRE